MTKFDENSITIFIEICFGEYRNKMLVDSVCFK